MLSFPKVVEWMEGLLLKTVNLGSIPRPGQTKDNKNWYLQLFCLTFSDEKGQCKDLTLMCGRQVGK